MRRCRARMRQESRFIPMDRMRGKHVSVRIRRHSEGMQFKVYVHVNSKLNQKISFSAANTNLTGCSQRCGLE